jgi:hypothetical protein
MFTLVSSLAAVVALMQTTVDAEKVTRCALSLAKLRIGSHFDDHVIESSAQILDGGVASLEPL